MWFFSKLIEVCICFRNKAKIIDGKQIAKTILEELKLETDEWVAQGNRLPQLTAILVGEDPASTTYVKNKMIAAKKVGKYEVAKHFSCLERLYKIVKVGIFIGCWIGNNTFPLFCIQSILKQCSFMIKSVSLE